MKTKNVTSDQAIDAILMHESNTYSSHAFYLCGLHFLYVCHAHTLETEKQNWCAAVKQERGLIAIDISRRMIKKNVNQPRLCKYKYIKKYIELPSEVEWNKKLNFQLN